MRKALLASIVSLPLLFSGCTTTGQVDQVKLDALIADIQKYTSQACGFLPAASSVINVIGAFAGTPGIGTTVAIVGGAICNGIVTKTARLGGTVTRNVATPKGVIQVRGTRV